MCFPARMAGVVIGMVAAAVALWALPGPGGRGERPGPPLSECDGAMRSVVIQYAAGASFVAPVYRDFLRQAPAELVVYVMCPGEGDYRELQELMGGSDARLRPMYAGHAMTCWSRDRWVALGPGRAGGWTTLLAPRGEAGAESWPAREGDQRLAFDLAQHKGLHVMARRSSLYFDGGDLMSDGRTLFVTSGAIRRNVQNTVADERELKERLEREFGLKVVLLEDSPDHHAGMFMMVAGDGTVLVGDPSLAQGRRLPELSGGADFSAATQARFDSVARDVAAAGYRVVRIPVAPAMNGKAYVTYVNAIIDQREGRRTVYMPVFAGAEELNDMAAEVWRGLGYEVKRVDCTSTYQRFGNLRCLVNVLER